MLFRDTVYAAFADKRFGFTESAITHGSLSVPA